MATIMNRTVGDHIYTFNLSAAHPQQQLSMAVLSSALPMHNTSHLLISINEV